MNFSLCDPVFDASLTRFMIVAAVLSDDGSSTTAFTAPYMFMLPESNFAPLSTFMGVLAAVKDDVSRKV